MDQVRFTGNLTVRKITPDYRMTNLPLAGERAIFGRALTKKDWQRLSGAPDGAEVTVNARRSWDGEHTLDVRVSHPALESGHLRIRREQDYASDWRDPVFRNVIDDVSLFIRPEAQPRGYGIQAASVMLHAARDLGIDVVKIVGARADRTTGYYTWPKLGFNAELSNSWTRRDLPEGLRGARDLLELYATPGGRAWWKRHGEQVDLEFDLQGGSPSWQAFNSYMRSSGLDARVAWNEPSSFHLPGRHDQKKHGRGGPGAAIPVRDDGYPDLDKHLGRPFDQDALDRSIARHWGHASLWVSRKGVITDCGDHGPSAQRLLRRLGEEYYTRRDLAPHWGDPAGQNVPKVVDALGIVRVYISAAHGSGITIPGDVTDAQKGAVMGLLRRYPDLDFSWASSSGVGFGFTLASLRQAWSEEPSSFHLMGRHDQKKHGRRGPGMQHLNYTGNLHLRFLDRDGVEHSWRPSEVVSMEDELFGRSLTKGEWQRLTGTPDGGEVLINKYSGELEVMARAPGMGSPASMYFSRSASSPQRTYIHDVGLFMPQHMKRSGLTLQAARVMFAQARDLGISYISIEGAGSRHSTTTGYFTWPKLGFDGRIPYGLRGPAAQVMSRPVTRLLELYESREGRAFWKRWGYETDMEFNLEPGSRSWGAFNSYMARSREGQALGEES